MAAGVTIQQAVEIFSVVFVTLFSAVLFAEGVFTAYFGRGRSRTLGAALMLASVALAGTFYALAGPLDILNIPVFEIVIKSVVYIVSGMLGALLALVIFLTLIVRT